MAGSTVPIDVDDPDPIKASYDVYIKPHLQNGRKLYILKFPNRSTKYTYSEAHDSLPLEFRMKPKTGIFEMDVPLNPWRHHDRIKSMKWRESMRKTTKSNVAGGAHGLAGGFGINAAQPVRTRVAQEEEAHITQEDLARDFAAAVAQDRALTTQTLGGQAVPEESATPEYMIGVFRGNQLHLTPVDRIVHIRPQFHHVDAQADLEKAGRPRESMQGTGQGPRAIHMTVKATADGEEETTDTMAERIRAAQDEHWKRMTYVDEDSADAWEAYETNLFVESLGEAPKLVSKLGDSEYLDAISAPRDAARLSRSKNSHEMDNDSAGTLSGEDEDVKDT